MPERMNHIDGLRAVAALLVIYQHGIEHWAVAAGHQGLIGAHLAWLLGYLDVGKVGVVVFFAVSGFVVPSSFRGEHPRSQFVISRLFRLFPAYWTTVLLATLVLQPPVAQAWAQLGMAPAFFGHSDLLGVFWTLRVEWVFYGGCLLLFTLGALQKAASSFGVAMGLLLAALAGGLLRDQGVQLAPVSLPLYLAVMMFGHLVRMAVVGQDAVARTAWPRLLGLLCVVIPLTWTTAFDDHHHKESVLSSCMGFLAGLALFVACVLRRAFGQAWLVHLGRISYGLYLLHPLALALLFASWSGPLWPGDTLAGRAALAVALTLLASQIVFSVVETPGIALGRRLAGTWRVGRAQEGTT